jgi:hypothetical protein
MYTAAPKPDIRRERFQEFLDICILVYVLIGRGSPRFSDDIDKCGNEVYFSKYRASNNAEWTSQRGRCSTSLNCSLRKCVYFCSQRLLQFLIRQVTDDSFHDFIRTFGNVCHRIQDGPIYCNVHAPQRLAGIFQIKKRPIKL